MDKYKINCPECKRTRLVSRAMIDLVTRSLYSGRCLSCANKANMLKREKAYDPSLYETRIYKSWSNMKSRCDNPNVFAYKDYGGRGITYVKRWSKFADFYNDMSSTYFDGGELERVDNNLGYSPENCRWATIKEQCNNRRSNRLFTLNGQTKTLAQWIELSGQKSSTVRQRFYVYNWPIEKALALAT